MTHWTRSLSNVLIAAFAVFVASAGIATAEHHEGTTYRAHNDARDVVTFTSKAPLEKIIGKASKSMGMVTVKDPTSIVGKKNVTAKFVVELASINTGISLRDQHMREQYLHTDKYPTATFTLNEVVAAYTISKQGNREIKTTVKGLSNGAEVFVDAKGTFELHGVKRDITVERLSVTSIPASEQTKNIRPGDLLRVAGGFQIKLTDYNVERPQFVILRLADEVNIDFDIILGSGVTPDGVAMACGCGGCGCGGCGDAKACGCGGCGCGDAKACGCGDAKACGCGDAKACGCGSCK